MEQKPLYGGLTVYRERGGYLRRLEQFQKAKTAYDEAYKFNPEDVRLLIGRSQVCSDAMKPRQAFSDAALALKLEPNNMFARMTQARAMYTISDFERSVVMNYQGSELRKQPPYFQEGISQGVQTLEDCIGKQAGPFFLDLLPAIKTQYKENLELEPENLEPEQRKHVSRIPKLEIKKKCTQMQAKQHEILSRVMAMKYLGPMASDKFFLQTLMEDPRIKSANSEGSQKLEELIEASLKKLSNRQEMLRTQRPYYAIKHAEKTQSNRLTKFKKDTLEEERKVGTMHAERSLKEMNKCLLQNQFKDLLIKAERLQNFLNSRTQKNLPNLNQYTDRMYKLVGEGYLNQYRISYKSSEKKNEMRVRFLLGLPLGKRPKSQDSVIASHPIPTGVDTQIDKLKKQLEMFDNSYMRCWLNYQLGRLELSRKNYPLSKFYALKCQKEAEELIPNAVDVVWWLNGCILLLCGDMQQGIMHEAKTHTHDAMAKSKELANENMMMQVQAFLGICLRMTSETNWLITDERAMAVKRERAILATMDDQIRADTGVLFKRMSTIPVGRRLSVLPKVQESFKMVSERRKERQQAISVVPGREKGMRMPPKSHTLGYQSFDL